MTAPDLLHSLMIHCDEEDFGERQLITMVYCTVVIDLL